MYIRKNIITVSLFSLGIILFSLCFYIGFLKLSNHELKPFEILGVEEIDGEVVYNIESNFYAKSYEVIITNEDDEIILDEKYDTNEGIIKNLKAYYLEELTVKVIAIHDEEIELEATNTYTFTWNSPTFSKSNSIYIPKETNFDILIDGDFTENSYKLQLKNSDKVIKEIAITDQVTTISYDLVSSYSGRISAFVIDENNKKLDSFNFYINTVIIGNVEILSPVTDYLTWDNFVFSYEGGDNADSLLLYIYKKGT
ncbi:MAG TPA: hypothetical protein PLX66_03175, partial [Bacilli bacterium]|nr:hypothetical protein [Bacilli bacterium]